MEAGEVLMTDRAAVLAPSTSHRYILYIYTVEAGEVLMTDRAAVLAPSTSHRYILYGVYLCCGGW